jgi:type IV pilus assembly protein PilW
MAKMKTMDIYLQRGLSLVELMVGMVLGLFLALGIAQISLSNNSSFRTQEGMAKIQEGGRYAMNRIGSAVRLAGFFGCSGVHSNLTVPADVLAVSPPSGLSTITTKTPIAGENDVSALTTIGGKTLVPGSDTITLRGSGMVGVSYIGDDQPLAEDIPLTSANYTIVEGNLVMIGDCQAINIVRATKDTTSSLVKHALTSDGSAFNTSDSLTKQFGSDAIVAKPFINTFFVADSGRTNHEGDSVMSLYVLTMYDDVYELVEGVSDLQVTYGVDTNPGSDDGALSSNRYMNAKQVSDANMWDSVVSARVSLLVDSVDAAVNKSSEYTFLGSTYTPSSTDRRLKKEFTGLFTMRNRAL